MSSPTERSKILKDTILNLQLGLLYLFFVGFIIPLPGDRGMWMDYYWPVTSYEVVEEEIEVPVVQKVIPPVEHPKDEKEVIVEAIQKVYKRTFPMELLEYTYQQADHYGLDRELVVGLIAAESSFRPNVKSSVGAVGYVQVWPKWHQDKIRGRNIMDPKVNIQVGLQYLSECIDRRGDVYGGLACYNGATTKDSADRYYQRVMGRKHEILVTALEIAGI